jgi:hypothetical protein
MRAFLTRLAISIPLIYLFSHLLTSRSGRSSIDIQQPSSTTSFTMSLSNKLSITDTDLKGKRVLIRVSERNAQ